MDKLLTALGVIALIGVLYGISWGIVVVLIKLIAMCFGLVFSLKTATGIWLVIVLLKLLFGKSNKDK